MRIRQRRVGTGVASGTDGSTCVARSAKWRRRRRPREEVRETERWLGGWIDFISNKLHNVLETWEGYRW
uniref:Uncharacterized protein n=1 Tax=Oryza brachyantha TaxID=4533 RepID=J3N1I4_ORYBR